MLAATAVTPLGSSFHQTCCPSEDWREKCYLDSTHTAVLGGWHSTGPKPSGGLRTPDCWGQPQGCRFRRCEAGPRVMPLLLDWRAPAENHRLTGKLHTPCHHTQSPHSLTPNCLWATACIHFPIPFSWISALPSH